MNAHRKPIACLTVREAVERFEDIVARLRAEQAARAAPCKLVPFPDPVGDDRDERPVIEWDLTRG